MPVHLPAMQISKMTFLLNTVSLAVQMKLMNCLEESTSIYTPQQVLSSSIANRNPSIPRIHF